MQSSDSMQIVHQKIKIKSVEKITLNENIGILIK